MNRLSRSWGLFKTSLSVLKQDKELLWMPVLSVLASILTIMAIAGVGFALTPALFIDGAFDVIGAVLALATYLLLAFVTLFFNAAVVAAANERLGGGDPTVKSALAAAWARKGRLFAWAAVIATVNLILQALRERAGFLGQIMAGIAGFAWNLATFFVVPTLLFTEKSLGDSVKGSAGLFKQTWGETVVGEAGIGFVSGLLGIAIGITGFIGTLALATVLGTIGLIVGIVTTVVAILALAALSSVLAGIYKAALYRWATGGNTGSFDQQTLASAFHP
ncbi:MAG: DUF6159 family protein [Thermoplasmatota archaeon]